MNVYAHGDIFFIIVLFISRYRFSMPNTRWPMPPDQLWYSLGVGPIYFITLNTEVFYSVPDQLDKHMTWLRDEFWKVNRNREQHPWLIVLGHKPLYSSAVDGDEKDTHEGVAGYFCTR